MHGFKWGTHTRPFSSAGQPGVPARFVVEQIDDACFRPLLDLGFQYNRPDGSTPILVTSESLPSTDFASIPGFMGWFVSRTGRHTPAALVHDQLVALGISLGERAAADDLFLEMMDELDVPPVRRTVMWAAVSLATRWSSGWKTRATVMVWGLLAAAGLTLLVAGLVTGRPWWVLAALVAPTPASLLWGHKRRAGLVAGYALLPVVFPAASSALGYATYWVAEEVVRRARAVPQREHIEEHPTPVAYREM